MLSNLLSEAIDSDTADFGTTLRQQQMMKIIVDAACQDKNRACLAVTITLLLKKIENPEQDIRRHQSKLENGFSGRTFDTKIVTPFLREENFPYMKSGSGWLTRSFEQTAPYDLNYHGNITPKELKKAFLKLIHEIQENGGGGEIMYFIYPKESFRLAHKMGKTFFVKAYGPNNQ